VGGHAPICANSACVVSASAKELYAVSYPA
jgi:hypothetical protein